MKVKLIPLIRRKMRFFKKDKRKGDGGKNGDNDLGAGFGASGGGGGYNRHHVGFANGNGNRNDGYQSFGTPPISPYGAASSTASPRNSQLQYRSMATPRSARAFLSLPEPVLQRIFAYVCPHAQDESYETCEQSALEDSCPLCDLRDLAHCIRVHSVWKREGRKVMYHSIRIDTVHYCDREIYLSEQRKRRSRFDRNGDPEDPSRARLKLLCRTLRDDPVRLGKLVEYLKLPYMLRESCQADLARTIAVLPHLKYVDLPEGLFADEPSYLALRMEVEARCLDMRKMTYMAGSELSLQKLATRTVWPRLEVLELIRIDMDPTILRQVLGSLANLRALKISDANNIGDEVLYWNDMLPPFPPLEELILTNIPNVTAEGIKSWLSLPEARQALKVLTLNSTGVKAWTLYDLLGYAPTIRHLSIADAVTMPMTSAAATHQIPLLSSTSLETLYYEVTAGPGSAKYNTNAASYYAYLANSLLSGGLPNLRELYVREPNFPDMLLGLPPPAPGFAEGAIARPRSSSSSNTAFSSSRFSNTTGSMSPAFSPVSPQGFLSPNHSPGFGGPPPPGVRQQQFLAPNAAAAPNPFGDPPSGAARGHRPRGSLNSLNFGATATNAAAAGGNQQQFSSNNPFAAVPMAPAGPMGAGIANLPARLEVYTKGDDEIDWSFVKLPSPVIGGGGFGGGGKAGGRPLSSYGLGADVMGGGGVGGWSSGAGARKSVLVGGAGVGGGFLALPTENAPAGGGGDLWPRPRSSAGERKSDRADLWR